MARVPNVQQKNIGDQFYASDVNNMINSFVAIDNDITAANQAISQLQSTVTPLPQQITDLNNQMSTLQDDIDTLQTQVNNIDEYDDTAIQQSIASIQDDISSLQTELAAIEDFDDTEIQNTLTSLQNQIDTLSQQGYDDTAVLQSISDLETDVSSLQTQINNIDTYDDTQVQASITAIQTDITTLQNQVGDIPQIQDDIAALQDALDNVEDSISGQSLVSKLQDLPNEDKLDFEQGLRNQPVIEFDGNDFDDEDGVIRVNLRGEHIVEKLEELPENDKLDFEQGLRNKPELTFDGQHFQESNDIVSIRTDIFALKSELGEGGNGGGTSLEYEQSTSNTIQLDRNRMHGTFDTPITGNIQVNTGNYTLGVTGFIIHSSTTLPTFSNAFHFTAQSADYILGGINVFKYIALPGGNVMIENKPMDGELSGGDPGTPQQDLIFHYSFDNMSGSGNDLLVIPDEGPNGINAVFILGNDLTRGTGQVGLGLNFPATANRIAQVQNHSSMNNMTQFTFATWIRPLDTWKIIAHNFDDDDHGWGLRIWETNWDLQFGISGNTFSFTRQATTGVWVHIAATLSANRVLRLYTNGVERANYTLTSGEYQQVLSGAQMELGGLSDTETNGFNRYQGRMDEVYYLRRALSASEVNQIYTNNFTY